MILQVLDVARGEIGIADDDVDSLEWSEARQVVSPLFGGVGEHHAQVALLHHGCLDCRFLWIRSGESGLVHPIATNEGDVGVITTQGIDGRGPYSRVGELPQMPGQYVDLVSPVEHRLGNSQGIGNDRACPAGQVGDKGSGCRTGVNDDGGTGAPLQYSRSSSSNAPLGSNVGLLTGEEIGFVHARGREDRSPVYAFESAKFP